MEGVVLTKRGYALRAEGVYILGIIIVRRHMRYTKRHVRMYNCLQ